MAFGFRTSALDGSTLISDSTYNPVYIGDATYKSRILLNNSGIADRGAIPIKSEVYYEVVASQRPFVFVVSPSMYSSIVGVESLGGSLWRIVIALSNQTIPRVLCFSRPAQPAANGYGLRIFRGNGECVFDSDQKHLFVDSVELIPPPSVACTSTKVSSSTSTYPYPYGFSYANISNPVSNPAINAMSMATIQCGENLLKSWAFQAFGTFSGVIRSTPLVYQVGRTESSFPTRDLVTQPVAVLSANRY